MEQVRVDNSNTPVIRSGDSFATTGATIKQDAARLIDLAAFTVMGRSSVVAGAVIPDGGNTGDGVVDALVVSSGPVPFVGNYNLECIEAVADGGIFKLEDPNGVIVAAYLPMTPGAGATSSFNVAGLVFDITDGAANFIVGDKIALAVAADGDYVPLAIDGVGGAGRVAGIYMGEDIPVATIVAGDVANNSLLLGGVCTFTKGTAVVDGGGAVTDILPSGLTVEEELARLGIFLEDTVNISTFENA